MGSCRTSQNPPVPVTPRKYNHNTKHQDRISCGDKTIKGPFLAGRPPLWAPLPLRLRISGPSFAPFLPL